MPFKWESAQYGSEARTSPSGDASLVQITHSPDRPPVYLTQAEMTGLALAWLDHIVEEAQHERAARLLAAWGEMPHV